MNTSQIVTSTTRDDGRFTVTTYQEQDVAVVLVDGMDGVSTNVADAAYAIAYLMRADGIDDYTIGAHIAVLFDGDRDAHEAGLGAVSDWEHTDFGHTLRQIVDNVQATR